MSHEFAQNVILNAVLMCKGGLKRGQQLRNAMHANIEETGKATGYRGAWLEDGVRRMFALLATLGAEFNEAHPTDRCSTEDIGDVLASCLATLRARTS